MKKPFNTQRLRFLPLVSFLWNLNKPDIKNGQCLYRQTKTWPPLATGWSTCLEVRLVIALAVECDHPKHTAPGEAGRGRLLAGTTLTDGYNSLCSSSHGWCWTQRHLNMDSKGSWSHSRRAGAPEISSLWDFNWTVDSVRLPWFSVVTFHCSRTLWAQSSISCPVCWADWNIYAPALLRDCCCCCWEEQETNVFDNCCLGSSVYTIWCNLRQQRTELQFN